VGNTVTVTDPAGKWKTFTMDAFGNLTKVVEPDSSQTNTSNQAATTYTYDALNHLIQVTMPRQMPGGNIVNTGSHVCLFVRRRRAGGLFVDCYKS
jgi:YD repeat-containing protein